MAVIIESTVVRYGRMIGSVTPNRIAVLYGHQLIGKVDMSDIDSLIKIDQQHLVHPLFHPSDHVDPMVWVEGHGATIRTADGREFIDGLSGLWNVNVGHGRAELGEAAARQMTELAYASAYTGNTNIPAIKLAEKLAERCYPSINHFFFTSGGGESNDSAFKTARFYWNAGGKPDKLKIISLELGYHGVTLGAMNATGLDMYRPGFGPPMPGFLRIPPPYPYRFDRTDAASDAGILAANLLEEAILREGPDTVAAFIAEPVQGVGGAIVPPDSYFPRIREICDTHDVLLIADEVITGFGRTGKWFALEHWGVEPDIISMAKGITSAYVPLGGIGLSDRVFRGLAEASPTKRWMHAYTYSGHPTCSAVALENIAILEREGLVGLAAEKGARLLDGLRQLTGLDHVGEVRGLGLMAGIELVEDKTTKETFDPARKVGAKLHAECVRRGLFSRFRNDIYVLAPPLVTSDEDIDRIVNIVGESIPAAVADH